MLSLSIWLSEVLFTFPSSWPQVIIKGTLILFCMRLPAQSRAQERLAMSALSAWKPQQVYKKSKLRSLETSHNHHCYFKTSRAGFIWPNLHANTVSTFELILSTPFIVKRILPLTLATQMFSNTFIWNHLQNHCQLNSTDWRLCICKISFSSGSGFPYFRHYSLPTGSISQSLPKDSFKPESLLLVESSVHSGLQQELGTGDP